MRKLLGAATVAASLAAAAPGFAAGYFGPLIGLWAVDGYTVEDAAKQVSKPLGEHPTGYIVYTNGGHLLLFFAGDNRGGAAAGLPSDADAGKYMRTMVAVAGTYKPAGKDQITVHVEASWNQMLVGSDVPRSFKIAGKKLTVTFAAKNPATGKDIQVTVISHRLE